MMLRMPVWRVVMPATLPPHSGPQLRTHAWELSGLKKPKTGRSKPETTVRGVVCPCPGMMDCGGTIVTESELSLKARMRLPSPLRAR